MRLPDLWSTLRSERLGSLMAAVEDKAYLRKWPVTTDRFGMTSKRAAGADERLASTGRLTQCCAGPKPVPPAA